MAARGMSTDWLGKVGTCALREVHEGSLELTRGSSSQNMNNVGFVKVADTYVKECTDWFFIIKRGEGRFHLGRETYHKHRAQDCLLFV